MYSAGQIWKWAESKIVHMNRLFSALTNTNTYPRRVKRALLYTRPLSFFAWLLFIVVVFVFYLLIQLFLLVLAWCASVWNAWN